MTQVLFRHDTAAVSDVLTHLQECDGQFFPPLSTRVDLTAYATKLVERTARFEAWVDARLVGLVAAYANDLTTRRGFVTSVSVAPDQAGQGVALQLMRACLEHARAAGMRELALEVSVQSERAVRLYTRLGFQEHARTAEGVSTMTLALVSSLA